MSCSKRVKPRTGDRVVAGTGTVRSSASARPDAAVLVYVALPENYPLRSLEVLDIVRAQTLKQLKQIYPTTTWDMVFTADRRWGEPAGLTQPEELTANPHPTE